MHMHTYMRPYAYASICICVHMHMYARMHPQLPDAEEDRFRFLSNADFLHVLLDMSKDDGLAQQVFDEACK